MHSFNGITTYLTPKTQFNHDYLFNAFDLYSRRWISNYKKPTNKKQRKGNDNMDSSGLTEEAVEKRRPKTQFAANPSRRITYKGKGGIGKVFVGWRISGGNEPTAEASILELV
ncbi:uncharacterized protein LOC106416765 [Brassica napus]|uniref:uncharacterized protein LOC106416765 n=1 Tax=Brassica napus TaxID=3708 RepID=UPI0006AB4F83|nr:uncharacterized protein LOC106416765 [Brassica napus]